MKFEFDSLKATQAAAFLLKKFGGRENYTKLLKMLYMADRSSLANIGAPISGARFVNMRNGPLASDVYECISGGPSLFDSTWMDHIRTDEYDVVLIREPGDSELSEFDEKLLTKIYDKYGRFTYGQMIEVVHQLPEWHDVPQGTAEKLEPEAILRGAEVGSAAIEAFDERNDHIEAVRAMLAARD